MLEYTFTGIQSRFLCSTSSLTTKGVLCEHVTHKAKTSRCDFSGFASVNDEHEVQKEELQ